MPFQEKKLVWGRMCKVGGVTSKKCQLGLLGSSQLSRDLYDKTITGHNVKPNVMR